jgi:hypothetical protein
MANVEDLLEGVSYPDAFPIVEMSVRKHRTAFLCALLSDRGAEFLIQQHDTFVQGQDVTVTLKHWPNGEECDRDATLDLLNGWFEHVDDWTEAELHAIGAYMMQERGFDMWWGDALPITSVLHLPDLLARPDGKIFNKKSSDPRTLQYFMAASNDRFNVNSNHMDKTFARPVDPDVHFIPKPEETEEDESEIPPGNSQTDRLTAELDALMAEDDEEMEAARQNRPGPSTKRGLGTFGLSGPGTSATSGPGTNELASQPCNLLQVKEALVALGYTGPSSSKSTFKLPNLLVYHLPDKTGRHAKVDLDDWLLILENHFVMANVLSDKEKRVGMDDRVP